MNRTLIQFLAVVVLFIPCSTAFGRYNFLSQGYYRSGSCTVDPFKTAVTVRNLKNFCNRAQLLNVFSSLSLGPFPLGRLKGYVIAGPAALIETVWTGKNFYYENGVGRDGGGVTNAFFGFPLLSAKIYRTIAPIDGREAFAVDYRNEKIPLPLKDYVRKVQDNLYLGILTVRGFPTVPIIYFILEMV